MDKDGLTSWPNGERERERENSSLIQNGLSTPQNLDNSSHKKEVIINIFLTTTQ
jgi:hypothetical protein